MKHYGLIGNPVSHSLSEKYFTDKFALLGIKARYVPLLLPRIESFPQILASYPDLEGLNVTSPFKSGIIKYCDELESTASIIRSVNTLKIKKTGDGYHITGYNTDVDGFAIAALALLSGETPSTLILGSGGAARAVAMALSRMGIKYNIVSRDEAKGDLTYAQISRSTIEEHGLIINATPLCMPRYKDDRPELPYKHIGPDHILYDLNYNPPLSPFLKAGKLQGAKISNGLIMLQAQAEKAWHIWSAEQ